MNFDIIVLVYKFQKLNNKIKLKHFSYEMKIRLNGFHGSYIGIKVLKVFC